MSISPKESLGGILSQLPRTAFMRAGDAPFLRGALITKVTAVTRVAIDVEPTQLSRQGYVRLQVRSHYHAFRRNPDHRAQASVWSACHDNFLAYHQPRRIHTKPPTTPFDVWRPLKAASVCVQPFPPSLLSTWGIAPTPSFCAGRFPREWRLRFDTVGTQERRTKGRCEMCLQALARNLAARIGQPRSPYLRCPVVSVHPLFAHRSPTE